MSTDHGASTYAEIMANPSAPASVTAETMLLDIDKITPEKWRTLIYNKIVKQKDLFVGDFKNTIIKAIDESMKNVNPDDPESLKSVQKHLADKIKQNSFDIEYHKFIDGIVGVTFEYFCQLIIINSFDNIKRTQNALSYFTLPNNVDSVGSNDQEVKPHFNDSQPEQSTSAQIQYSPGSNNNTTETGEGVNLTQLFNNTNSILLNTQSSKINTSPLAVGLSGINLTNKYVCANNSPANNEDDELKSDSSILSIAMNINEEDLNMRFADDFEADDINNAMPPDNLVEQNSDINSKLEEERQINAGLELLQNLVNIEHDKLEVQNSSTVELPQSKLDSNEKKQGKMVNKSNTGNNMNVFKTPNQNIVGELSQKDTELKKNDLRQTKLKRKCVSYTDRTMRKKSKTSVDQNKLNNKLLSDLNTKVELDKIYAMYNKNSKSTESTSTITANIPVSKKECTATSTSTNVLSIITNPIASTSSYNGDISKTKSFSSSVLSKSNNDCKQICEMYRKSLFNRDNVLKPMIKENKKFKKPDNKKCVSVKKSVTKKQNTYVTAKSKKVNNKLIKVKIGCVKNKLVHPNNTVPNSTFCSSAEHHKIPKNNIKTHKEIEHKSSTEANANTNNTNEELNTTDILKNDELNDSQVTLENQEPSGSEQMLEIQELNNEQLLPENPVLSTDISENNAMPEWIKKLIELYKIKPVYVVVERNKRY